MSVFLEPSFVNFINKLAQQPNPETSKLNLDISKSLLQDLRSKLSLQTKFVSTKSDSEIYLQDVESTDKFLEFLKSDEISFSGARLCFSKENIPVYGDDLKKYSKYPKADNFKYYIRKDLVISFIDSLLANSNPLLKTALSKIKVDIGEINAETTDTEQKKEEFLSPDTIIDWWYTSKTIDLTNPLNGIEKPKNLPDGMVVLKKKDLDSVQSLKDWLSTHTIKINDTMSGSPGFNVCSLLQSLYKRAVARNSQSTAATKFYVAQIQSIGPQFTGPDNKACTISVDPKQKIVSQDTPEQVAGYTKDMTQKDKEDLSKTIAQSIDLLSNLASGNVLDIEVIRDIVYSVNKAFNLRKIQSVTKISHSVQSILGPELVENSIVKFVGQTSITMEQSQFEQFGKGQYQNPQRGFYGKFIYNLSLFIKSLIHILNTYKYHFHAMPGLNDAIQSALNTLQTWDRDVTTWGRMYSGSSK